jgi:hypothetical protein
MVLEGAKRIVELFDNDEFKPIIIQGDHGYGKSSYANWLIASVYGENGKPKWYTSKSKKKINPIFETHVGFHPKHVLDQWTAKNGRDYVYHWDDAGLWLHSLDFQDPFVKEVGKYMQVVRTDWACVIFTAISMEDISSKIRGLRNAIIIDITKEGTSHTHPNHRTATAYILRKTWKGKPWKDYLWKDVYNSHVPNKFYNEWYKPLRNKYSELAKERMQKKLQEHKDLSGDQADY